MNENIEPQNTEQNDKHGRRDADTQIVLGIFISIIALPVIVGTLWAEETHAMIVNIIAGLTLLGVGVSMVLLGRRNSKNLSD